MLSITLNWFSYRVCWRNEVSNPTCFGVYASGLAANGDITVAGDDRLAIGGIRPLKDPGWIGV